MRYLLAILTCGRPDYLERTLATFAQFMRPAPVAVYAWDDGLRTPPEAFAAFPDVIVEGERDRIGRCSGHARLWEATRRPDFADLDWVFTIEDDLVLLRPLYLPHLAEVIEAEEALEQLALVRCPWGLEVEVGGFIPLFPGRYERRETLVPLARSSCQVGAHWVASTVDWTSSPALLPAALPRALDWPGGHGCELELGPRIHERRPEAVSGYWGWGEPWVAHIGLDRVAGAYGY